MPNSKNDLSTPQKILKPKVKFLAYLSVLSSVSVAIWSFTARIPTNSKSTGFIVPAYEIETLLAPSDGRSYQIDHTKSKALYDKISNLKQLAEYIKYKNNSVGVPGSEDLNVSKQVFLKTRELRYRQQIISDVTDFLELLNETEKRSVPLDTLKNNHQESFSRDTNSIHSDTAFLNAGAKPPQKCYNKDLPIFYIANSSNVSSVIDKLNNARASLIKLSSRYNQLKYQYKAEFDRSNNLNSRVQTAKQLYKKKVLTEDKILLLQENYLSSVSQSRDILNNIQNLNIDSVDSLVHLRSAFKSFINTSLIHQPATTCLIQVNRSSGSMVKVNDILAVANGRSNAQSGNPKIIPFFYLSSSDQGIRNGAQAVIYPANVPKNVYGGIPAEVISSGRVLSDTSSAHSILGLRNIEPFEDTKSNTIFYGLLELDISSDKKSGYQWTSSDGPDFPLLIGTKGEVDVIVSTSSPISYVLPFLRKITGQ